MPNPFDSRVMARGYAMWRPPVHARVMELAAPVLRAQGTIRTAVDVGCGAGLSTRALQPYAERVVGVDPVEGMFEWRRTIAPGAEFVGGRAEALPLADGAVDLMAAAGSLNFAALEEFFPEAARVLKPGGLLLVYDYSPGRSFAADDRLDGWFAEFLERYPAAPSRGRRLNPAILSGMDARFEPGAQAEFAVRIELEREFYREYVLTGTNVAAALERGESLEEARAWCEDTLKEIWGKERRDVVFPGYFVFLKSKV